MKNAIKRLFGQDLSQEIILPQSQKPLLRSLEPRIVLDAAAVETGIEAANQALHEQQAEDYIAGEYSADDSIDFESVAPIAGQLPSMRRDEIVFIDPEFHNFENLLAAIDPALDIVVLDRDSDGFEQIAEALNGRDEIYTIHTFAGGEDGNRSLGSTHLSDELVHGEFSDELTAISAASLGDSELLIYSTDFENDVISESNSNIASGSIDDGQDLPNIENSLESQENDVSGTLHDLFSETDFGADSEWMSAEQSNYFSENPAFVGDKMIVMLGDFDGEDELGFDQDAPLNYDALQAKQFLEGLEGRKDMLQIYFNSYVRHSSLYVTIDSNDKYFDDMHVEHYSATLADGSALPEWIKLDTNGLLSIKQLDDVDSVELNIIAVLEDGSEISKFVSVETRDGSLTSLGDNGDKIIYREYLGDRA